jgi:hypothetical protein
MYLETPDGGHTGLLSAFYSPDVYGWLFDHLLPVPEPTSLLIAVYLPVTFALKRNRSLARRAA